MWCSLGLCSCHMIISKISITESCPVFLSILCLTYAKPFKQVWAKVLSFYLQNSAARLITRTKRHDHINPLLPFCTDSLLDFRFKILLLILSGLMPKCLTGLLTCTHSKLRRVKSSVFWAMVELTRKCMHRNWHGNQTEDNLSSIVAYCTDRTNWTDHCHERAVWVLVCMHACMHVHTSYFEARCVTTVYTRWQREKRAVKNGDNAPQTNVLIIKWVC